MLAFKRIGELLGPAKQVGNNPYGRTGKPEIESQPCDSISRSGIEKNRDWQARQATEQAERLADNPHYPQPVGSPVRSDRAI